jgi:hypothetical protein
LNCSSNFILPLYSIVFFMKCYLVYGWSQIIGFTFSPNNLTYFPYFSIIPWFSGYLMLGAGTSTFRDRGPSAFRLLLHDTTFRFWPREAVQRKTSGDFLSQVIAVLRGELRKCTLSFGDFGKQYCILVLSRF